MFAYCDMCCGTEAGGRTADSSTCGGSRAGPRAILCALQRREGRAKCAPARFIRKSRFPATVVHLPPALLQTPAVHATHASPQPAVTPGRCSCQSEMKRPRVHQRPRATPLQGFVAGCVAMLVLFAVTRQSRQPLGKAIIASVTQPHEANQRHAAEMHDLPRVKAAAQVAQQAAPQVTAAAQAVQQAAPQAMAAAVQAVQALPQVTAAAAQAVQALPQVAAAAQAVQVLPQAAAAAVVQPAAAAAALPVAAAVPAQVQGAGQTFEVTVLPLELASGKLTYPHIFEGIKSQLNTERNSCYEGVCFDWYRAAAETFQSGVERAVADRISGALRAAKDRPPVFFDVGANAGFYTVLAGAHGAVAYAFEPQPACASIIQQSVELNKNRPGFGRVKLHNVALKSAPVPDKVAAAAAPAPDDLKIESDGTAKPVDGIDVHLHICHGGERRAARRAPRAPRGARALCGSWFQHLAITGHCCMQARCVTHRAKRAPAVPYPQDFQSLRSTTTQRKRASTWCAGGSCRFEREVRSRVAWPHHLLRVRPTCAMHRSSSGRRKRRNRPALLAFCEPACTPHLEVGQPDPASNVRALPRPCRPRRCPCPTSSLRSRARSRRSRWT